MKQALQLYPEERKNPNLLTDLAIDESDISNSSAAIYYAKKSLDINPKHVGALVEMGDALRRMGNSSAPIFFKKALSIPLPPNPPYWILDSIANAYVDLKNYTSAISVADQILQKRPNDLNVLGLKGIALLYLNNNKDALAIFNKILTIRTLVWDLDNKALSMINLGNITGALSVLDKALNITQRDTYTFYNKAEALGLDAIVSGTDKLSGIGFAIPANTITKIVPILIEKGYYPHAYLGLVFVTGS